MCILSYVRSTNESLSIYDHWLSYETLSIKLWVLASESSFNLGIYFVI